MSVCEIAETKAAEAGIRAIAMSNATADEKLEMLLDAGWDAEQALDILLDLG